MKRFSWFVLTALWAVPSHAQWKYPPTRAALVSDTYFGTTYQDPYRWLENLHDPATAAWFKAQATLTDSLLASIPGRDALAQEWMALDKLSPARFSGISLEGGRVFYKKTLGGENVGKLYYRQGWSGSEKLLLDPSAYKSGVATVIQSMIPSFDGRHVVVALSANGAEVSELRVIDVDRGTLLSDRIDSSLGPMSWAPDNVSFFYDAGPKSDPQQLAFHLNRKVRMHRLASAGGLNNADTTADVDMLSDQSHPELKILAKESPALSIDEASPDYVWGGAGTAQQELRAFYAATSDLKGDTLHWKPLCEPSDSLVGNILFDGAQAYAMTHTGAPRFQVIRASLANPDWNHAAVVVPQGPDPIRYITRSRDFMYIVYSNGVTGHVVQYAFKTGKSSEVQLPESGSVDLTCPDARSNRCIVSITSWIRPTTLYDFDADGGTIAKSIFNSDVVYPGFENLVTEEVEVPGHDGTLIPLSIIHERGMKLDGNHSCILEGYGCYGISLTPRFSIQTSIASRGVVRAIAHVRGGGEKGEAWHAAGFKATKPNTWLDFISCAEYLVKHGYTSPERLAGTGTSAGGILISRAITERPDLFAAAVCNVGDANAMRCEFGTDGPANAMEYGTVKDSIECRALYEMDGVKHVRSGVSYPALMGVGGWNDPRVAPWQPGKFVAAVQVNSTSKRPVLMKVNYDNGHFTEEKLVTFRNFSAQYSFMLWQTGHPDFQPAR